LALKHYKALFVPHKKSFACVWAKKSQVSSAFVNVMHSDNPIPNGDFLALCSSAIQSLGTRIISYFIGMHHETNFNIKTLVLTPFTILYIYMYIYIYNNRIRHKD
jgi:hypothetical protein